MAKPIEETNEIWRFICNTGSIYVSRTFYNYKWLKVEANEVHKPILRSSKLIKPSKTIGKTIFTGPVLDT